MKELIKFRICRKDLQLKAGFAGVSFESNLSYFTLYFPDYKQPYLTGYKVAGVKSPLD
ncbi:MAG: hypothetical protein WC879_11315 [Melioribacteraceae bacterium]